jgi:hypothetical protein
MADLKPRDGQYHIPSFGDGHTTPRRVVTTAGVPLDLLIHAESLYVLMYNGKVYEYALLPALELK